MTGSRIAYPAAFQTEAGGAENAWSRRRCCRAASRRVPGLAVCGGYAADADLLESRSQVSCLGSS